MSVLIKGMEMPKSCACCDIACRYYLDHGLDGLLAKICRAESRLPDCPLVPVPPHGRLIDADEMFEEFVIEGQRSKRYKIGEKWELNGEEIRGVISRLPTIIPADDPKEE